MKVSFWDILAAIGVLALCAIAAGLVIVFVNPYSSINPFPPATLPARVVIPSDTPTLPRLPATWTVEVSPTVEVGMVETSTLASTATEFILPTLTASLSPTPESTATYTPAPNQALWISQAPSDGVVLQPKQDLDMVWKIKNTGILTWNRNYSYRFVSGEPLHKNDEYGLRKTIEPGMVAELVVDMVAPADPGNYYTQWALYDDAGKKFYSFNFSFTVR